jgi:2TM domain
MENQFSDQVKLERARKKVKSIKGFYKHLAAYIIVNAVLLIVKAVDLEPGEPFFAWGTFSTALWWGLGLLFHGFGVFGTDVFLGSGWEERKIKEYMDKNPGGGNTKWE